MLRWIQQLGMLVVLVGLAASAWSQTVHYAVPAAFDSDAGFDISQLPRIDSPRHSKPI